jgi:ParB family chromosome partitioning protein
VVVRESGDGYELVVGERRWRAAELAGLTTIPAMVKDVASRELLEMALVENVQRHDLNPIELALAFRALTEGGATQEQVGERVGLDRSTIANHLRLLELPRELQQEVESGVLSAGHAKALLQIDNPERRRHLRDRIVANQLSVRAAEELARSLTGTRTPTRRRPRAVGDALDPHLQQLVDSLRDQLQTKVKISTAGGRGKIEIEFYGPEDLHRITQAILEGAP